MRLTMVIAILILACDAMGQRAKPITHGRAPVVGNIGPQLGNIVGKKRTAKSLSSSKKVSSKCDLTPSEQLLVQDLRLALKRLERRQLELDARELALKKLKQDIKKELEALRAIQKKMAKEKAERDKAKEKENKSTNKDLADALKKKQLSRKARIQQLAAILKKMKPAEAALIIDKTEDDIAVAALEAIGARAAGKIVAKLSPDRANQLMKALVKKPIEEESE